MAIGETADPAPWNAQLRNGIDFGGSDQPSWAHEAASDLRAMQGVGPCRM